MLHFLAQLPVCQQFDLMQFCPVEHQAKPTTRQLATDQCQISDVNDCLVLGIVYMEVRRRMVFEKHLDDEAIKGADALA